MSPGLSTEQLRTQPVTTGRQDDVRGDGTDFYNTSVLSGQAAQGASLTRRYRIPVEGTRKVLVTVKPTTTGTAATARIYSVLNDGTTENTAKAATSLTITNNTITEASRAIDGERFVVLEIVTVAASTVAFTVAEYRTEAA